MRQIYVIASGRRGKSWLNYYLLELRILAMIAAGELPVDVVTPLKRVTYDFETFKPGATGLSITTRVHDDIPTPSDKRRTHRHHNKRDRWT